ncbi:MAG: SNF2-related protein [Treponema sp.]|nr:SNF2-related protein [Treponema sp.]MCL2252252.1 SNF2-related protein [Treponema sp.]
MKNRYGITPWGLWFIDVLDSYRMGERLERGRRYANAGKVLSLELTDGRAVAKVEGKSNPFYRVAITFPTLAEAEQVYNLIENDPPLLAQIAAGELPETFLQLLKSKKINLIPKSWREMKRSCSCPDNGDPCKHMAALYYIIAREIDSNPQILFRLRGIDLSSRFGSSAVHKILPPFTIKYIQKEKEAKIDTKQTEIELEEIPHCAELITSLLPPDPPFCERNFTSVIAEFYHLCASYVHTNNWEQAQTDEDLLSQIEHDFSRSHWIVLYASKEACANPSPGAEPFLQAQDINGNNKQYTLFEAFNNFVQFSSDDGTSSYNFLFYLFKALNLLCSAGAFIPYVLNDIDDTLKIIWRPFEILPSVSDMLNKIAERGCGMFEPHSGLVTKNIFKIDLTNKQVKKTANQTISGKSTVDILASAFLNEWIRHKFMIFKSNFNKEGDNDYKQLLNLFFLGMFIDVSSPAKRSLPMSIDRWLSALHIDFSAYRYAINIKDITKKEEQESDKDFFQEPLNFGISMDVLTETEDGVKKTSLAACAAKTACNDINILRAPLALSNYLPEIKELFKNKNIPLSEARLVAFLDSAADLLTRLGLTVNLPKALVRELKPRLVIKGKTDSSLVKYLDLNSLQDFEWQIAIGEEVMSLTEFEKLVKIKRAIVRFRDGFVKMQAEEFSRLLKNAKKSSPDLNDFLKAHFNGDSVLAFDAKETIDNLFREQNFPIPSALNAELRPYQKRGYNWICSLLFSGFGCILADDMGLGKTIQSIAAILRLKEEGLLGEGCLIVAPAALLCNWEKELSRFAPSLKVTRYHGTGRKFDSKNEVFLTTYQTTVRDAEKLKKKTFSLLLVDEAHLMKNSQTRISRTIKNLKSKYKLALSGTPVENRLEDLRSLFDFILPGYLGDAVKFREQYRIPIEVMRNKEKAQNLQKITSPFLLRRLKTDKSIIKDLPEKVITTEYAVLEKEQAALYETIVSESMEKSKKLQAQERSSLIFYLLTSLKQICDHPRVYDKESPASMELSGKAQLLITLLKEILANREKTLIFSQYVETLECLEQIIKKELSEAPLLYHGGLGQEKRAGIVNTFQNDPSARILLISLKAGGLGLNLTAASRVIHYDLWYNPAVENQATDRAFRIGQERTVFVHRFVTKNSFEEKIDAMLTSKQELADLTIKSGESWLARMSHEELKELFER